MNGRGRSLLRHVLAGVLVAATIVFLALAIARNWEQVAAVDWQLRPAELALSVLLLIAALGWGVFVWHRVLVRYPSADISLRTLLWIWFLSNLARYVPGKIWQFVGAVQLGRRAGVAAPVLLTSMAIHTGLTLVSAALVSLLALPTVARELGGIGVVLLLGVTSAGLLGVHPAVINRALRLVPERIGGGDLAWSGSWSDGLRLLLLAVGAWLIYGAAFALLADSLIGISWQAVPALIAANALSFLIGYAVFISPGGLGAREAALTLLLGPMSSLGVAAVIAVVFRLWLIPAELLGAGLMALAGTPVPEQGPVSGA